MRLYVRTGSGTGVSMGPIGWLIVAPFFLVGAIVYGLFLAVLWAITQGCDALDRRRDRKLHDYWRDC